MRLNLWVVRLLPISVAVSSTGCALRPWTPSVSVAFWSQPVPSNVRTVVRPSMGELRERWVLPPSSPWFPYIKMTLLSAAGEPGVSDVLPDAESLDVVHAADRAAFAVARAGLPPGTLWITDLRGAASIAFASTLSRASPSLVAPIMTFNNWPAEEQLVPAHETLAALLTRAPRLPSADATSIHPVFMLDAWRLAYREDEPSAEQHDNRYVLWPTDFPSAAVLAAQGIRRVLYVVENLDETSQEEDDVHAVFDGYDRHGISISMVDLAQLEALPLGVNWDSLLAARRLFVPRRRTLLDDPSFYARSRGGFGGLHRSVAPHHGSSFGRFFGGRGG